MITREEVDGLVLAGGRSSRMQAGAEGDVDKGLISLQNKPLVQWVSQYLSPRVSTIYVSANRNLNRYGLYGRCVQDDPNLGRDIGPLAGVASVMAISERPWLFVLPVDVPRVPNDLFDQLVQAVSNGAPLAYAQTNEGAHPLCMLVQNQLCADLRDFLRRGGRKVLDWQHRHGAVPVNFHTDASMFGNINTPDDLLLASQR